APDRPLDTGIRRALWLTRAEIAVLGDRLRSPLVLLSIDAWLAGQRLPLDTLAWLPEGQRA
ncbi:MAG TPA: NUDIX hydrolase, partial [Rhodanobacter sp.]